MVSPWDFDPAEIAIPVHLWHGEKDANAPLAMGRYLAERIPEARPTVVPGEAHLSLMANHAEVILRGIVDRARTRAAEPAR